MVHARVTVSAPTTKWSEYARHTFTTNQEVGRMVKTCHTFPANQLTKRSGDCCSKVLDKSVDEVKTHHKLEVFYQFLVVRAKRGLFIYSFARLFL